MSFDIRQVVLIEHWIDQMSMETDAEFDEILEALTGVAFDEEDAGNIKEVSRNGFKALREMAND